MCAYGLSCSSLLSRQMADLKDEVLKGFTQCTKDDVTLNNYISRSRTLGLLLYMLIFAGSFANTFHTCLLTYLNLRNIKAAAGATSSSSKKKEKKETKEKSKKHAKDDEDEPPPLARTRRAKSEVESEAPKKRTRKTKKQ